MRQYQTSAVTDITWLIFFVRDSAAHIPALSGDGSARGNRPLFVPNRWAHRQRVKTTFLTRKKPTMFLVILMGIRTRVTDVIES